MVAVAFTPATKRDSPNLKTLTPEQSEAAFHRLIATCFSSVRRWNTGVRLVLVTTQQPNHHFQERLRDLDADILLAEFNHRPPAGFYPAFNTSLFSIDAMETLARTHERDRILLLDPDVLCADSLLRVFEAIDDDTVLAYNTGIPPTEKSQGLSALEAAQLHRELSPDLTGTPAHYGGELYGFTSRTWSTISQEIEEAWQFSLRQWRTKAPRFVTEEHLMNYALRHVEVCSAESFIRRIWTAPTYRTARIQDVDLPLWHLPSEKQRGLSRIYQDSLVKDSWMWSAENQAWRTTAARICGIGQRSATRASYDALAVAARYIQRHLGASGSATDHHFLRNKDRRRKP